MSFNVAQYPSLPYRLTPIAWPVKIFDPAAIKPASVMLQFDWLVYFALGGVANQAVTVDLAQAGTAQGPVLDKIVTCKIDNSNSNISVLVYFQDSGDVVSCPPQTIATLPCNTNGTACKVIAQGLSAGNTPLTNIYFYNYFVPPSIDPVVQLVFPQYLGSPAIQRGNLLTPGFGPPTLGDQAVAGVMILDQTIVPPTYVEVFPPSTGFLYITGINVIVNALRAIFSTSGNTITWAFSFYDNTAGVDVLPFNAAAFTGSTTQETVQSNQPIFLLGGFNFRLNATHSYGLRFNARTFLGTLTNWNIRLTTLFTYTTNPN